MSIGSRTLRSDLPTASRPFVLLCRGMESAAATLALWRRRARERRQLALWLSASSPGFLHDTSILCTEGEVEANKPFWRA
jgi:hypothetical protein